MVVWRYHKCQGQSNARQFQQIDDYVIFVLHGNLAAINGLFNSRLTFQCFSLADKNCKSTSTIIHSAGQKTYENYLIVPVYYPNVNVYN